MGGYDDIYDIAGPTTSSFLKKFHSHSGHALALLQGEAPPPGDRRAHARDEAVRVGSRDGKWRGGCERVRGSSRDFGFQDTGMPKTRAGPPSRGGPATQGLQPSEIFTAEPPERFSNPADQKSTGGVGCHILRRPADDKTLFEKIKAAPGMPPRRCKAKPLRQAAAERTLETKLLGRKSGREMAWRVRAGQGVV